MITLNGKDISTFGVTLLYGTKEELFKYPKMKAGINNTSRNINGIQADPRNRRYESRSVTVKLRLKGVTEQDYNQKYITLLAELTAGKDNTGINELYIAPYMFRLIYEDCNTYRPYSLQDSEFAIDFTEPNPANIAI